MELKFTKSTPLKIWLILLAILAIAFISFPGKAESGSISITSTSDTTTSLSGAAVNAATWNFSKFMVDNTDFTGIRWIILKSNILTFPADARSADFQIQSGGTGGGIVYFDSASQQINWYFIGNVTLSSNLLIFNYSSDIFSGIGIAGGDTYTWNTIPDVSQPVCLKADIANFCIYGWSIAGKSIDYLKMQMEYGTTNFYDITYSGNVFTSHITKQSINTKIKIHNFTNPLYTEPTFNIVPFNYSDFLINGIYLNMTLSTGAYKDVLINSSGTPSAPTPPSGGNFNPPLTIPSSGGSIQFNQTKYVVGDTARIEWAISNSDWNSITAFEINIIDENGGNIFSAGALGLYGQSGNFSFIVSKPETLTATLKKGFVLKDVLSTAYTTVVPEQPSTLLISFVVAVGKPINFTYMYGFTPSVQAPGNGIFGIKDGFTKAFTSAGTSIVALTTYSANITFPESGNYVVQLKDVTRGVVAFVNVNATFSFVPPTQNITTTSLTLDKSVYLLNDVIDATYALDNNNYSHYQIYYQVSHYASGIIEDYDVVSTQTGDLYVDIAPNFASGLSRFALRAKNDTADYEITYQNFTVSKTNNRGFGMQITPPRICAGTKITINLTIPESAQLKISETQIGGLFVFKTFNVNNNTALTFTPSHTTPYTFELISTNDNVVQLAYSISPDCGVTPTPTSALGAGGVVTPKGLIDGWVGLLGMGIDATSRFFFAVVITIIITMVGFVMTGNNSTGGIVAGFIPYSFFTYIDYVPKWFILVAIIIMGIKLRWFN